MVFKGVLSLLALLGAVNAQNSTVSLALIGLGPQTLGGSIIASDATATTYLLSCVKDVKCWLSEDLTFTQGPSTIRYVLTAYEFGYEAQGLADMTMACSITTDHGTCSRTLIGTSVSVPTATVTLKKSIYDENLVSVTITAGPEIPASTSPSSVGAKRITTSLFLNGVGPDPVGASIIASDATATTYSLDCMDPQGCGIHQEFIFVQGPSTVRWAMTGNGEDGGLTTYSSGCEITTDHGSCSLTMTGIVGTTTTSSTQMQNFNSADYQSGLLAVTITAGPAITTSTATVTSASSSASSSPSNSGTRATAVNASSSSSTGGAPRITNGPVLFAGGAAAALVFAAM